MIKNALTALPARPVLYIAPLIVVLVLSLYYRDQYSRCADIKQQRASLNEWFRADSTSGQFRLVDFTDFAWNKVRVVASVEPDTISNPCPLDWNWERDERDALVASGRLTALIFGRDGKVVHYLELRSDEVAFEGKEFNLTPQNAIFNVDRAGIGTGITLSLLN